MSSNVVVIDTSLRRHTVKTTPQKPIGEVLSEACAKFGLDPNQYGLKYNDRPVDLSRTIRLSNLIPGAKLTLVQVSKSPTVVSLALQIPPNAGSSSTRLTDKFSSDTSLWQVLRRFESGAAGGEDTKGKNLNFTQRASVKMMNGDAATEPGSPVGGGAGRLYYETPVFNVLGRTLDKLEDMQKTLAQLGISGKAMIRVDFRETQQPLEEAMDNIAKYFKSSEEAPPASGEAATGPSATQRPSTEKATTEAVEAMDTSDAEQGGVLLSAPSDITVKDAGTSQIESSGARDEVMTDQPGLPETKDEVMTETPEEQADSTREPPPVVPMDLSSEAQLDPVASTTSATPPASTAPSLPSAPKPSTSNILPIAPPTTTSPTSAFSNLKMYSPPATSTPLASSTPHNPSDYEPSTAHALAHQALLSRSGRNKRLESDAELAHRSAARATARAEVASVMVRLRFMDQSVVERDCGQDATVADLYGTCDAVLDLDPGPSSTAGEMVELRVPSATGVGVAKLAPSSSEKLIADLGWRGGVLVTVVWRDQVPAGMRKTPCLKAAARARFEKMRVEEQQQQPVDAADGNENENDRQGASQDGTGKGKKKASSGEDRDAKMKRLMGKMLGKK